MKEAYSNRKVRGLRVGMLILLLAPAVGVLSSHAATLIYDASNRTGSLGSPSYSQWYAQSFQVDASGPYNLASVELNMAISTYGGGNFFVAIYDNNASNLPGSNQGTLSGSTDPAAAGTYTYTPTTSLFLAASSTYWVVAGVSSGAANYRWVGQALTSPTSGSDIGWARTLNQGSSWDFQASSGAFNMKVYATPVPEPGEWGMVGLLLAGGFAVWRRRVARQR